MNEWKNYLFSANYELSILPTALSTLLLKLPSIVAILHMRKLSLRIRKWKLLNHVRLSPGQNTGMDSHSVLQGIFSTQGSNPGLPHCRQILYQLSHKGSPILTESASKILWRWLMKCHKIWRWCALMRRWSVGRVNFLTCTEQWLRAMVGDSMVKNLPTNAGDAGDSGSISGWEEPLQEEMATSFSILACKSPCIVESGRLQYVGLQRVGHDLVAEQQIKRKGWCSETNLDGFTAHDRIPRWLNS